MLEAKVKDPSEWPTDCAHGLEWPQSPLADLHLTFKLTSNEFIFLLLTWMVVPGERTLSSRVGNYIVVVICFRLHSLHAVPHRVDMAPPLAWSAHNPTPAAFCTNPFLSLLPTEPPITQILVYSRVLPREYPGSPAHRISLSSGSFHSSTPCRHPSTPERVHVCVSSTTRFS